jgi:hypothetical protein
LQTGALLAAAVVVTWVSLRMSGANLPAPRERQVPAEPDQFRTPAPPPPP